MGVSPSAPPGPAAALGVGRAVARAGAAMLTARPTAAAAVEVMMVVRVLVSMVGSPPVVVVDGAGLW